MSYPLPFRLLPASLQLLSPVGSHDKLLSRVQNSFGRVVLFSLFCFQNVLLPLRGMNESASLLCMAAPNALGLVWVLWSWVCSSQVVHTAGCVLAAPVFIKQGEDIEDITKMDVMLGNAWQSSSTDAVAQLHDKGCNMHVCWWLGLLRVLPLFIRLWCSAPLKHPLSRLRCCWQAEASSCSYGNGMKVSLIQGLASI